MTAAYFLCIIKEKHSARKDYKMKKILSLILAFCLVFTMAGCGPVHENFEGIGESAAISDGAPNETPNSDDSAYFSGADDSSNEEHNSPGSSSSTSSGSSSEIQSSSASKPQSSPTSSTSDYSKKPQSSSKSFVTSSSSAPSSVEIIENYGRRAQETWEIEYADEVFRLVNAERVKNGLPEFKKMQKLTDSATIRAWECIVDYNHKRPDGQGFETALTEQDIKFKSCGENIAAGQTTPQQVVEAWMNSPGHRANILSEKFEYLGVGFYYDKDGTGGSYRYFWAQNFCKLI